jgi:Rrf2 family nitric oxide-sensitive transcriptional repressor
VFESGAELGLVPVNFRSPAVADVGEGFSAMKLSLFSDYSLRTLMYAAVRDESFQLDEVTTAYGISRNHVAKVVHHLAKLGYLETQRGRGGGIRLARPMADVRIGTLVRETESDAVMVECFDPATNSCPLIGSCRLKGILAEAMQTFYASLDRYTLRDLVSGPHRARMSRTLLGAPSPGTKTKAT